MEDRDARFAALLTLRAADTASQTSETPEQCTMRYLATANGFTLPNRGAETDDWLVDQLEAADEKLYLRTRKGNARPTVVREFDKDISRIDLALVAQLTEVIRSELARLLRSVGLKVTGAINDPKVKAVLSAVDLEDVAKTASETFVVGGKTAMAVSQVVVADSIEQASGRIRARATKIMEDAEQSARDAVAQALGIASIVAISTLSVVAVVERLVSDFVGLARVRLGLERASDVADVGEIPIGESGSSNVSPGVAAAAVTAGIDATGSGSGVGFALVAHRLLLSTVAADPSLVPLVRRRRAVVGTRLVWRHSFYGRPRRDFPPHKALDKLVVGAAAFTAAATVPLEQKLSDGTIASTPPFSIGGWHPQDHIGCMCGYEVRTVLEVI